jgi:hypothetical protein
MAHRHYTRYGSPNVARVEAMVADLEGAEEAVAVRSGMAAISTAILSHVRAGDHVVAQTAHYTAALTLLTDWLPRQDVAVTQVDQTDIEAFGRAIGPKTKLVYTETPTNPTMALTDLAVVADLARARGAITDDGSRLAAMMRAVTPSAAQISIIATGAPIISRRPRAFSAEGTLELAARGKSSIKRSAIARESAGTHRPAGNRAIKEANLCAAVLVGSSDNSTASCQGSTLSRDSAERTLSGISFLSSPIDA